MKAFVAGATGQTGCRIVRELVQRGIQVRGLVRNLDKAQQTLPPEVETVTGDVLNPSSLQAAIGDSTVVICATGATPSFDPTIFYRVDYEGTKNLINVAKANNIEQFVLVSSLCVSRFFHPLNLFGLVLVWKKQAEEYLQSSGLTYTIVRPGGLKNEENEFPITMQSADNLFDGSIPRGKVAQVCVEALLISSARNKIVEIVAKPEAQQQSFEQMFASVN